jgi:hypothetical protein
MDGSQGGLRPESVGLSSERLETLERVMTRRYVDGGLLPGYITQI